MEVSLQAGATLHRGSVVWRAKEAHRFGRALDSPAAELSEVVDTGGNPVRSAILDRWERVYDEDDNGLYDHEGYVAHMVPTGRAPAGHGRPRSPATPWAGDSIVDTGRCPYTAIPWVVFVSDLRHFLDMPPVPPAAWPSISR